jgi:hypothetical protein
VKRARLIPVALLAACGSPAAKPDAPPLDAALPCVAQFTGNFTESSTAPSCAMITHTVSAPDHFTLALTVPSVTLGTSLVGSFDLGTAPSLGLYSSRTLEQWRARAAQRVGEGTCLYAAGSLEVPQGNFELQLTALADPDVHGTLDLTQFILGFPSTNCGTVDTEMVTVSF